MWRSEEGKFTYLLSCMSIYSMMTSKYNRRSIHTMEQKKGILFVKR